jgi:predicted dienelactone hydrolase
MGTVLTVGLLVAGCSAAPPSATEPVPQNTHAVGMLTETFVDTQRPTVAWGPNAQAPSRTLVTTIFYPAEGSPSSRPPDIGATPDRTDGPYPHIVFAHGLGSDPLQYEKLLGYWAAAGFVVAAPRFPLTSDLTPGGPDAGDVVNQPADMSFVITSVTNASAHTSGDLSDLVNSDEVGAAGHSNGAITTLGLIANTCCKDQRIKAAVVMAGDEVPFSSGTYEMADAPPLLLVHGTADQLLPYPLAIGMFNAARGPKGLLTIHGGGHESAAALSASSSSSVLRTTTDFFTAYLRGDHAAIARISGDAQSGVTAVRFVPQVGSAATIPLPPTPKLHLQASATPTTNLVDGQEVTVRWSGYTPGAVVNILECGPSVVQSNSSSACNFSNAKILTADPTGHGSVQLQMVTGTVGTSICDAAHPGCLIVVNNASSTAPTASVRIPISFGP